VGLGEVDGGAAGIGLLKNSVTFERAFANCPRCWISGCSVPKTNFRDRKLTVAYAFGRSLSGCGEEFCLGTVSVACW